jgi:hypothetical protein
MNQNIFNTFTTNRYVSTTKDFLESNSLVAKFAFILLILFLFIILLRLGIFFMYYFLKPESSIKIINGMVDGKHLIVVPQDPNSHGAKTITRSVNEKNGIEFTWSCWIFIDDLTHNSGKYKCIFYKGNDYSTNPDEETLGLNFPNNAPGLYIAPNTNDLIVLMNTFNVINEKIIINDIPLNKWVNVIIRCTNRKLDVYINGTITKSHKLSGVPKQNYGNIYISPNGGFSGYTSNLWYYNYALGTLEISELLSKGPNTKMVSINMKSTEKPNYLSLRWYFYGQPEPQLNI